MNPEPNLFQSTSTPRRFLARFVRAGALRARGGGKSEMLISAQALQSAAAEGKFDNQAVFLDHASYLEHPSLARLIGRTGQASFNPETQAVEGEINLLDNPVAEHALSLVQAYLANPALDIGLSLVFYPEWDERQPERIQRIRYVDSLDLVFQPAAGGRFLHALSTTRQNQGEALCIVEPSQTTPSQNSIQDSSSKGEHKAMNQVKPPQTPAENAQAPEEKAKETQKMRRKVKPRRRNLTDAKCRAQQPCQSLYPTPG